MAYVGRLGRARYWLRSSLLHNVASLFATQVATSIFPLILLPYLARVLHSDAWGRLAFAQAFANYVTLVVEFGFNLSATREVAHHRDDRKKLSHILSGVIGAKLLLTLASAIVVAFTFSLMPILAGDHKLLYAGILFGVSQGFNMAWFFQGLERMKLPAAFDVGVRAVATTVIVFRVHRPEDAWQVLLIQALASSVASLVLLVLCYRVVPLRLPSWKDTYAAIHNGAGMFLFRSAVSLYTIGNALILGFFASPTSVGYYAGGERIERAFVSLTGPFSQSLFPRLTNLVTTSPERAARLIKISLFAITVVSVLANVVLWALAPLIVRIILGPGFGAAVPVFRILTLLVPATAISGVLGLNWMLPLRLDKPFNMIIIGGGVVNLTLALVLARSHAQIGMATAVAISECAITGAMFVYLHYRKLSPLRDSSLLTRSLVTLSPTLGKNTSSTEGK